MKKKTALNPSLIFSILIIAMFPMFFNSCSNEVKLPTDEEAKAAVLKKIQAANSGWASENPMIFAENAAEDVVWIDDIGGSKRLVGREALKTYLEGYKGQVPPHKHELYDFNLQLYRDVVIASYFYQGTMNGEKLTPWKAVSIFRYINDDWYSVLEHWTITVEEKKEEISEET